MIADSDLSPPVLSWTHYHQAFIPTLLCQGHWWYLCTKSKAQFSFHISWPICRIWHCWSLPPHWNIFPEILGQHYFPIFAFYFTYCTFSVFLAFFFFSSSIMLELPGSELEPLLFFIYQDIEGYLCPAYITRIEYISPLSIQNYNFKTINEMMTLQSGSVLWNPD